MNAEESGGIGSALTGMHIGFNLFAYGNRLDRLQVLANSLDNSRRCQTHQTIPTSMYAPKVKREFVSRSSR
jgi:hypothetical protein